MARVVFNRKAMLRVADLVLSWVSRSPCNQALLKSVPQSVIPLKETAYWGLIGAPVHRLV